GALNGGLKAGMDLLIPIKQEKSGVEEAASKVSKAVTEAAETTENALHKGLTTVESALQTAGNAVKETFENMGNAISNATSKKDEKVQNESIQDAIPQDVEYRTHKVKWYETINSISRKYNISVPALMQINDLSSTTLSTGQLLRIPEDEYIKYFQEPEKPEYHTDDQAAEQAEAEKEDDRSLFDKIFNQHHFRPLTEKAVVTLLLPFDSNSSEPSTNYFDFYAGFTAGLEKMKNAGMELEVNVLDESEHDFTSGEISKLIPEGCHFVVGPVYADDLAELLDKTADRKIPIISPLDPNAASLVEDHSNLIQMPASSLTQIHNLIASLKYDSRNDNVLVIHEKNADLASQSFYTAITQALEQAEISYSEFQYGILGGREIDIPLKEQYLNIDKNNKVIIASEKESFASDAVRNISLMTINTPPYKVTGYSSAKLRNFESIEQADFEACSMHFSPNYYIDYSAPEVRDFVLAFREKYNTEPTAFAFQGYDIATYFLQMLKDKGPDFIYAVEGNSAQLLQSNVKFERKKNGGLANEATRQIVYLTGSVIEIQK
ncbi:MAG: ABC transporter substrate-binding protein, partial [Bacteroidales bacterium]|nr:ABC transporter substrate-binding protein [Bacteroidales bacterium]